MMCVIGSEDTTYAFSSIGFEPVVVNSRDEALRAFEGIQKYDIILIEESIAKDVEKELAEIKGRGMIVIEIPGINGSTGYTKDRIRKMVINAVGMDIFKGEKNG
jgi:vacuolar-type H+-ATPase subunit F/Vma7